VAGRWLVLTALTVVFALATVHVLDRRALAGSKGRHAG
jgi:hypothetical protein